jgi:Fe-S oxidoreductase
LTPTEKILFFVLATVATYYATLGFGRVIAAIASGQRHAFDRFDGLPRRIGAALVRTLSQRTVFRARRWVSLLHSFIFFGFTFYLLVNILDGLKGYLPEALLARIDLGLLGDLYRLAADVFTLLVLIGVAFMLLRRFAAGDPRLEHRESTPLHEKVQAGGTRRDSLIVGLFILLHVGFRLTGEGFLLASEGHLDPWQPTASALAALVGFGEGRIIGWHIGWWGALGLIVGFLPYFPRSKHLHLFAAPVNFAFEPHRDGERLPSGALPPIDFEDETLEQFGVARLEELRWPQLLDPYACIQCNRCADVCPANRTGKALSPAALEINKRYELTLAAGALAAGEPSPRPLLDFAISPEALWACTTCGACMEVCPVGCEQMIDIVDLRRERVMMEGDFPAELQNAFRGLERAGNPWGIGREKRMEWAEGMAVPTVEENPDFEVLFWVGCAGSYDPAAQATTRAMAELLEHAGVNYAVLGKGETCTGDPARRAGNEYLYYQLASENVATLDATLLDHLDPGKRKRVVTTCPHCFNALFNDYPQLGGDYDVMHHTQLLEELVGAGRLPPLQTERPLTYHDPCYLGRHNEVYDAPRQLLTGGGAELREMPRSRNDSFCCGAGGAQFWKEEEAGSERVSDHRMREAQATGAEVVAAGCPFCKVMLGSGEAAGDGPEVIDIAQLMNDSVQRIQGRLDGAGD